MKKVQKENKLYMDSYILYVMFATREYPSLDWRWKPDLLSIHFYCKMLWENKYKEDSERICNDLFAPIYQILFSEEAPCLFLEGHNIVQEYGDWYMLSNGFYIRILGSIKSPHWLHHFVPDTLLLQDIGYQTYVNGVVASLHKCKKVIWPYFPLSTRVYKIENFSRPKKKSIFYHPLHSKMLLFEGMILKENLKNICNRLDSIGVMHIKTYFLGN